MIYATKVKLTNTFETHSTESQTKNFEDLTIEFEILSFSGP